MSEENSLFVFRYFSDLPDPRRPDLSSHKLIDILFIALAAGLCGADTWVAVERFATSKEEWLRKHLELPGGIPSHDTFGRVFTLLSPKAFEERFRAWVRSLCASFPGEVIAIDGKTARRSHDRKSGKGPLHMVSAWGTQNGLVLGQLKVADKSNEITAVPELLESILIKGCVVTADAMHCQKDVARKVIEKKGDYVLALKGNQSGTHKDAVELFEEFEQIDFAEDHDSFEETTRGRGREVTRRVWTLDAEDWLKNFAEWPGLKTVVKVESTRIEGGKKSVENRYYLSSLPSDAERHAQVTRVHWEIENKLHWSLDVAFSEDQSRVRKGYGAENLAVLRRVSLNILRGETSRKVGIKIKRQEAGWSESYLEKCLALGVA